VVGAAAGSDFVVVDMNLRAVKGVVDGDCSEKGKDGGLPSGAEKFALVGVLKRSIFKECAHGMRPRSGIEIAADDSGMG